MKDTAITNLSAILVLAMVVTMLAATSITAFSGGDGVAINDTIINGTVTVDEPGDSEGDTVTPATDYALNT